MTASIIPHQCDYGRVGRDSTAMPKFRDSLRHPAPMHQNRGKTPGYYTRQTAHFENGAKHATITASINPTWGISVKVRCKFLKRPIVGFGQLAKIAAPLLHPIIIDPAFDMP